jgi:hypothetical protein
MTTKKTATRAKNPVKRAARNVNLNPFSIPVPPLPLFPFTTLAPHVGTNVTSTSVTGGCYSPFTDHTAAVTRALLEFHSRAQRALATKRKSAKIVDGVFGEFLGEVARKEWP